MKSLSSLNTHTHSDVLTTLPLEKVENRGLECDDESGLQKNHMGILY